MRSRAAVHGEACASFGSTFAVENRCSDTLRGSSAFCDGYGAIAHPDVSYIQHVL